LQVWLSPKQSCADEPARRSDRLPRDHPFLYLFVPQSKPILSMVREASSVS
jgi:hypothetical protein